MDYAKLLLIITGGIAILAGVAWVLTKWWDYKHPPPKMPPAPPLPPNPFRPKPPVKPQDGGPPPEVPH